MLKFSGEVRNVQAKPNETVEIKLVVGADRLSGQMEELTMLVGKDVSAHLESDQISFKESIDPQTKEPIVGYLVDEDGKVHEYTQTKLDLKLEELEPEERENILNRSEIDEYILQSDGEIQEIEGGSFDGKEILERLTAGEELPELAEEYNVSTTKLSEGLENYRKFVAAKAKAWLEWKSKENEEEEK